MKRYSVVLVLLILVSFLGCQRDDICPETVDTTPLLVIRFYENQDPFDLKAPQNLVVRAPGNDTSYVYYRFSQDSIAVPLRTDTDVSELIFTVNTPDTSATDPVPGVTDTLRFSYGREQQYLNRACAYKVNFVGLNVELIDPASDENWVEDIRIEQPNVEDQKTAHVSIFF